MRLGSGGGVGFLTLLVGGWAAAQGPGWTVECAPNAAGQETCLAKTSSSYRTSQMLLGTPSTMVATVQDNVEKPKVTIQVNATEVRYAQLKLENPDVIAELICGEVDCTMSFADARATIDGITAGRTATLLLFTNIGQIVQIRLPSAGFAEAVARTRPN